VCGRQALWLVGSATSKAGLWDLVVERESQILLIDELDKMSVADTTALLSLMEGGRLVCARNGNSSDSVAGARAQQYLGVSVVGALMHELYLYHYFVWEVV